jgi:hypothetical protein
LCHVRRDKAGRYMPIATIDSLPVEADGQVTGVIYMWPQDTVAGRMSGGLFMRMPAHPPVKRGDTMTMRWNEEGLFTDGGGASADLAEFALRRTDYHATFNGGWEEPETRRAFHHGMDTVFNGLDAAVRGESDQTGQTEHRGREAR